MSLEGPSEAVIQRTLQVLADCLNEEHPGLHFFVPIPGQPVPPNARVLPVVEPANGWESEEK